MTAAMHAFGLLALLIALFSTGSAYDHRPAVPHAALVQDGIKPPKGIETVRHKKAKGTGYTKGSPLYKKQKQMEDALKEGNEQAGSPAAKEASEASPQASRPGF